MPTKFKIDPKITGKIRQVNANEITSTANYMINITTNH